MAIFVPALTGELHAARAVAAARALLEATGHGSEEGPWLPIGIGVHTGVAYVGAVGEPPSTTLTALGDPVNVPARLASAAGRESARVAGRGARGADRTGWRRAPRLGTQGQSDPVAVLVQVLADQGDCPNYATGVTRPTDHLFSGA